jgi:hypothetical protein
VEKEPGIDTMRDAKGDAKGTERKETKRLKNKQGRRHRRWWAQALWEKGFVGSTLQGGERTGDEREGDHRGFSYNPKPIVCNKVQLISAPITYLEMKTYSCSG